MSLAAPTCPTEYAPFSFYAPILKSADGGAEEWVLEGPLSESGKDLQQETMRQGEWGKSGLRKGLETFKKLGCVVDWEHLYERTRDPEAIIGKGIELFDAPHPTTGEMVPWLRVRLYKAKRLAQKVWEHLQAGGGLGFSVAGAALKRLGKAIHDTMITSVAITAVPVVSTNAGSISAVIKALSELDDAGAAFELPIVAELRGEVLPLFRALSASPDLPHAGPGVSALMTEDLGAKRGKRRTRIGNAETDEDEDEEVNDGTLRKARLTLSGVLVRKACALQLAEALASRMA